MEQVLRKLYQEHHKGIQRKRLEKVLQGQHYVHTARKKYDFSDQIARKTRQTSFSFDEDIRFEKQFQSNQKNFLQNLPSIQAKYKKYNFADITKKKSSSILYQRFKAAATAIVFLQRLKRKLRGKMFRRKRKVQKMSTNFIFLIEKMVRNYYQILLREQLINYIALLQKKLINQKINQQKQSIQLLYYISQKLANSSLIKQLMQFFVHIATDKGFQPEDFLSSAEINRLDFSCLFGCIINVSQQQTRMIIGLGLGIKIFCFYILYQPWNLSFTPENFRQDCKIIKQTIYNFGSVFYYLIFQQFCLNLKEIRTLTKSKVLNLYSKAIKQLNPFNENQVDGNSKILIVGQTRSFLNNIELKYPSLLQGTKQNLFKWISRISYACLKENEKRDKLKDESSTFSSTITAKDKRGKIESRNVFRSIELNRKRDQLVNLHQNTRYNLPKIKRTIQ